MKNLEYHAGIIVYQLLTRNTKIVVRHKPLADRVIEMLGRMREIKNESNKN